MRIYIAIGLCLMFALVHGQRPVNVMNLISSVDIFKAGDSITLTFKGPLSESSLLYCSSSYGTTLISPKREGEFTRYKLPTFICSKSGLVQWTLNQDDQVIDGSFFIQPQSKAQSMETYLGPPAIQAGGRDYAMIVSIPTDALDNPLQDTSVVKISRQFKDLEVSQSIKTNNFVAHTNIDAPLENGRILLSAEHHQTTSKEFTLTVYPSNPKNFDITASRPHEYADGNQITTFKSSTIKDQYGNVVSDGTYVEFIITTNEGTKLKTAGATLNGQVEAYMIHPDKACQWRVIALIEGLAESNELNITYRQSIKPFETALTENNRRIIVGPIKSFMNQLVPDGLDVKIELYLNDDIRYKDLKTTEDGMLQFTLQPDIVPSGTYNIKVSAAGIEKELKDVTLW